MNMWNIMEKYQKYKIYILLITRVSYTTLSQSWVLHRYIIIIISVIIIWLVLGPHSDSGQRHLCHSVSLAWFQSHCSRPLHPVVLLTSSIYTDSDSGMWYTKRCWTSALENLEYLLCPDPNSEPKRALRLSCQAVRTVTRLGGARDR